jgi:hypothetical protein
MSSEAIIAVTIPLGFFGTIAYITQVLTEWRRQKERTRLLTEFQTKLLDKMGSGQDFAAFFQSQGGERFLSTLSMERSNPYDRVIRAVQTGIVMTCLSLGLVYLGRVVSFEGEGLTIIGVVVLSLGVGFLLSAGSAYAISRSAGLLDRSLKTQAGPV